MRNAVVHLLRQNRHRLFLALVAGLASFSPLGWADQASGGRETGWTFVLVTSGVKWTVVEGTASVAIRQGRLLVELSGANSFSYVLDGNISPSGSVRARFTNTESDFFIRSPLRGTYKKNFFKDMSPCGQELLHLHDGLNFLGIKRSIYEPECKP